MVCLTTNNTQDNPDTVETVPFVSTSETVSDPSTDEILEASSNDAPPLGTVAVPSKQAEDNSVFWHNEIRYKIKSDKTCKVTDYSCDQGRSFAVPDTVTKGKYTYVVDEIGDNAFSTFFGKNAQSVELGPNIKRIGVGAFKEKVIAGLWSGSLKEITFREIEKSQLTVICDDAFLRSGITRITIPASVTEIGSEAFSKCKSLTTVNILSKSVTIGHEAFYKCTSLTSINLENAYRISSEAFKGCSNLTDVNLSSAWDIREYAFDGCNLRHVTFASNIAILENNAFKGYCFSDTNNNILPHNADSLCGKQFFKDIDNWYHQR